MLVIQCSRFRAESQQGVLDATGSAHRFRCFREQSPGANSASQPDVPAHSRLPARTWLAMTAACVALAASSAAGACPGCPVGREARQQVYEQHFARNLLVALLPFAMVGLASLCAERVGQNRKSTQRGASTRG